MTEQFPTDPTNPYPEQPANEPANPPYGQPANQPYGQPANPPYGQPGGYAVQPQPISPSQERTLGAIAHGAPLIAMVLSAGTLGFVGSLVIYLMYKDRGPFVRAHAANSLNIQIITGIVLLISIPLMFVLVGIPIFIAALIWAFVMHVMGAVKANNGEWWNPPMTPRFVR